MSCGIKMPAMFTGSFNMEDPHCTLIYLGEAMHPSRQHIVEEACLRLKRQVTPLMVPVTGLKVFGNGNATVLLLEPTVLKTWRVFIDKELRRDGIMSASEWAYNPHVTINTHTTSSEPILPWEDFRIPPTVWIGHPEVWWR